MSASCVLAEVAAQPRHTQPLSAELLSSAPPVPATIEDTGLSPAFIEQLLLRTLYFRGDIIGRDLANAMGLRFSLIEPLVENCKRQHLVQMKRSTGFGNVSGVFGLTEAGRNVARDYIESTQYTGPAPVPLHQYTRMVRAQRPPDGWLTPEALKRAYQGVVMPDHLLAQIGPAVGSNQSFLIYGQPGNGKTFMAESLINLDTTCIYMPYAIEYQGSIIQLYDAVFHQLIEDEELQMAISLEPMYDRRWFKCRRPFIVSGGELALNMLDLSYNPASKVYDAPLQLKANNGIYLIDDFGRQRATPAEVLNRWIVPMERRVDYLTLLTGGKLRVPFEAFLVFSTNLRPDQLGDEAFLRRIQYKMHLPNPGTVEFIEIFQRFCESRKLECPPELPGWFVETYYGTTGKRMRRCHPRDVLSHAINLIHFERRPLVLTKDILDHAFWSCFTEVADLES